MVMKEKSVWGNLLQRDVLGAVHRFDAPPWREMSVPAGHRGELDKSLFSAEAKDAPDALKAIVGPEKESVPRHTTSPENSAVVFADMALMLHGVRENKLAEVAAKHGWCLLLRGTAVCVKKHHTEQWYLPLGDVGGLCGLGWPMREVKQAGNILGFEVAELKKWEWLIVLDPYEWDCVSINWLAPWGQRARKLPIARDGIMAAVVCGGTVNGLLKEAAARAFWDLNHTSLH